MDAMIASGFVVGGTTYSDGPYSLVDWTTPATLQSAISIGPVKLGIDADALPAEAGNQQGVVRYRRDAGAVLERGPLRLSGRLRAGGVAVPAAPAAAFPGTTLPSGLDPAATGYLLFTWGSIGFVDDAWLMSTVG